MNYLLFCTILNDNLVYEFTDAVSPEEREEWQHEWYCEYKDACYVYDDDMSAKDKVISWMRDQFSEVSFDTHNFQLKEQ